MIDYFALGLGHGLIAIVLLRLFMRSEVDFDPLIGEIQDEMQRSRKEASAAHRNAKRRAKAHTADEEPDRNGSGKQVRRMR